MRPQAQFPLRIYYDASCPMCRSELHGLKSRDENNALDLVDCSGPGFTDPDLDGQGIPVSTAMNRIHARDAQGRWFDGVEVFELAYGAAGMRRTAKVLGHPRLRPLLDRLYPLIARNRKWLSRLGLAPLLSRVLHRQGRVAPSNLCSWKAG